MSEDDEAIDDGAGGAHSAEETTVYALKVGNLRYAIGLFWNDVDEGVDPASSARKMAARPGMDADLFVVRASGQQYGLAKKEEGLVKGMPSLAAHLADTHRGSWCGAFEVEGGYYVIAVSDDVIRPDTDRLFADSVEARNAFDEIHSMRDWSDIYAPDDFGVDGSRDGSLQSLLTGKPRAFLQEVDRVSNVVRYGGYAIVALLLVGGGMYAYQWSQQNDWQTQLQNMPKVVSTQPKAAPRPPAPWENKFLAGAYIQGCVEAMKTAVMSFPGWKPVSLECDGGTTVVLNLLRTKPLGEGGGPINWVRWTLDKENMQKAVASPEGENGVKVAWNFTTMPKKYGPDIGATHTLMEVRRYMQSNFEEMFTPIKFSKDTGDQFFKNQKFSFSTSFDPTTFVPVLEKVAGLTITKITYDLKKYEYNLDGESHELQPLPQSPQSNARPGQPGQPPLPQKP